MAELQSLAAILERPPPHEELAERAVLGAVLLDNATLPHVQEQLVVEDFYRPAHGEIFRAMLNLSERAEPVDPVTLQAELKLRQQLDRVGGAQFVAQLMRDVHTTANVSHYVRLVKALSSVRRLVKVGEEIATRGRGDFGDVDALVAEAESRVAEIARSRPDERSAWLKDVLKTVLENVEARYARRHEADAHITGVPTGFRDLDRWTSGLQKGALTIVAARPAMGKSTLALNLAWTAAMKRKEPESRVLYFSLEMGREEIAERFLVRQSFEGVKVPAHKLRVGRLTEGEIRGIVAAKSELAKLPILIDDSSALRVMEVRARCKRVLSEAPISLVIIDYLQLMSGAQTQRFEGRQTEVASISRGLKALAMELSVPVVAVAQLSRNVERREGMRPQLSDLRESGAIEQDADLIVFLHREPPPEGMPALGEDKKDTIEVIIGKQRNGPTGATKLFWGGEYFVFRDLAEDYDEDGGGGGGDGGGGGGGAGPGGADREF
ncbi:MAG TPA: replicative DNA helicase [Myxococcota bacterium]|nr:replicative DNA helicase [Myxococcota bacterium]